MAQTLFDKPSCIPMVSETKDSPLSCVVSRMERVAEDICAFHNHLRQELSFVLAPEPPKVQEKEIAPDPYCRTPELFDVLHGKLDRIESEFAAAKEILHRVRI